MNKIKLFLENKGHENPRAAYACMYAYAGLMYAYTYMGLCIQLRF